MTWNLALGHSVSTENRIDSSNLTSRSLDIKIINFCYGYAYVTYFLAHLKILLQYLIWNY